jgi:hypothetical protein
VIEKPNRGIHIIHDASLPTDISLNSYTTYTSCSYTRLVIGTSRTVGSAKKFVRITSCFGGGEFTKTLTLVLKNNNFIFDGNHYLQINGTAMPTFLWGT